MNGLYSNMEQKKRYYNTPELYINGFWVSLLCTLGFKIIKPQFPQLNQFLNKNYLMMLYSQDGFVDDNLPDFIISIKVLRELNIINQLQTKTIFLFLDDCKNYKTIDQNKLRRILKLLPIYKIRPNNFISDYILKFLSGKKDLEFIVNRLFVYNQTNNISSFVNEYGTLIRSELNKYGQ